MRTDQRIGLFFTKNNRDEDLQPMSTDEINHINDQGQFIATYSSVSIGLSLELAVTQVIIMTIVDGDKSAVSG
ncbi:hypothetical protein CAG54_08825 [Vibrio sp. V27_P1S3P104]|uniref:hypothetical protein n=1 Tax=Vibrio sp. V27_P1S3P104 TaxID=1938679 RepID=UPI000C1667FA|nr:hypothetical protein [Vibrio sp. V27_P1S3P104]NAX37598.1 hypothetical protein [Vibrio sp. V27_P1S3P104]